MLTYVFVQVCPFLHGAQLHTSHSSASQPAYAGSSEGKGQSHILHIYLFTSFALCFPLIPVLSEVYPPHHSNSWIRPCILQEFTFINQLMLFLFLQNVKKIINRLKCKKNVVCHIILGIPVRRQVCLFYLYTSLGTHRCPSTLAIYPRLHSNYYFSFFSLKKSTHTTQNLKNKLRTFLMVLSQTNGTFNGNLGVP